MSRELHEKITVETEPQESDMMLETESPAVGQPDAHETHFVPELVSLIRNNVPGVKVWDDAIYMNTAGFALVPPPVFLVQMPVVFLVTLFFGWLMALVIVVKKLASCSCGEAPLPPFWSFWYQFITIFAGASSPLVVLALKLVIRQWGISAGSNQDEGAFPWETSELLTLWMSSKLSAIELLAPCAAPVFVACIITCCVYEFSCARACAHDIGDELDELGLFPSVVKEMSRVFKSMEEQITTKGGKKIKRFGHVPFVDRPDIDFEIDGSDYAETWAIKQAAVDHPVYAARVGRWYKLMLVLLALLPALLPHWWMQRTHPDEYLQSSLFTVKFTAYVAAVCIFIIAFFAMQFGLAVWSDFVMIRCHFLTLLYISANEVGRRYVYRLWKHDISRLAICRAKQNDEEGTMSSSQSLTPLHLTRPRGSTMSHAKAFGGGGKRLINRDVVHHQLISNEDYAESKKNLERLVNTCRRKAFPSDTDQPPHEDEQPLSDEGKKEKALERLLDEHGFRDIEILDVEKFAHLRACLKPNLMLARVRLELCLIGSTFTTISCGIEVLVDFEADPYGHLSCIGIMSIWLFLVMSLYVIVCVHTAVMMNMAILDSSLEILRMWKARITAIYHHAQGIDNVILKRTFSNYQVQLANKFRSLLEPFEDRIRAIEEEKPLTFVFIPTTPVWRNRLIGSLVGSILLALSHYFWTWICDTVAKFDYSHSHEHLEL